ncbi:response regulator [Oscillochloris sp. ZM17-4]|uniref:response regulator n=1 Tax=Oscillochloris sp. ZM17-4 TaxID=2866714 RepID=UPI001C73C883|nr:response regulator [Oscillochloris sp. ZM17-4]MBX0326826.1 response regulator [Oscillochloris sp. ZM17-4]
MSKRILIVDDDPDIRRIVTLALSDDSPYIVNAVSSAEAALLHIARQPVDLLFTDIQMPGMNGLDLVRRVHELDPNTAVVIFTVSPEDLTPDRAADLNIDCLLAKPVEPDRLRQTVDMLLNPIGQMPRPSQRAIHSLEELAVSMPVTPEVMLHPSPPPAPAHTATGPLGQRLSALRAKKQTGSLSDGPVAMRLTPNRAGSSGRSYSDMQIEQMRLALKDLAMEPDVACAVLADMSGMVLTHWSRQRDINVTVVAALAAGNTIAMTEISRNLGQRQPGRLVIHEGQDLSIMIATMDSLLLLIAIGPQASLGWARIAVMRACEDVLLIARGG